MPVSLRSLPNFSNVSDFIIDFELYNREELLQLLVGVINTQLLKGVHLEHLEAEDVQEPDKKCVGSLANSARFRARSFSHKAVDLHVVKPGAR